MMKATSQLSMQSPSAKSTETFLEKTVKNSATKNPPTPPPALKYYQGAFCWNELATNDVAAATSFYTGLFGYKTEQINMGSHGCYTVLKIGERSIGGIYHKEHGKGMPSHWMCYIHVDDVDAITNRVIELGGRVKVSPRDIPNVGKFSVIIDPTGAEVALFEGLQHDNSPTETLKQE